MCSTKPSIKSICHRCQTNIVFQYAKATYNIRFSYWLALLITYTNTNHGTKGGYGGGKF
jgi:hypothetical protein